MLSIPPRCGRIRVVWLAVQEEIHQGGSVPLEKEADHFFVELRRKVRRRLTGGRAVIAWSMRELGGEVAVSSGYRT